MPQDWEIVRIDEVAETCSGGTPSRLKKKYYGGPIPWVKSGELKDNIIFHTEETLSEEGLKNSAAKLLPKGTLLIAMYGATTGKTGVLGVEAATNQAICAITPTKYNVDLGYLQQQVIFKRSELLFARAGGAQPNISQGIIRGVRVPLPALDEQRTIVEILSNAQDSIQYTNEITQKAEELKEALMHDLLTVGVGHDEFKYSTELDLKIPKDWTVVPLGQVCEKITVGIVVKPASYYVPKGVPALRSLNVKEDRLDLENLVFVSERDNRTKLAKSRLRAGDVVIVRTGYPGTACVVPKELDGANCVDLIIARPRTDKIDGRYVSRVLNSPVGRKQCLAVQVGLAQQHFNIAAAKKILIPLPPLDEQRLMLSMFSAVDQKVDLERDEIANLLKLREGLMDLLLTGKIRVRN